MAKRIRFNRKNKVIGNMKKALVVSLASVMMLQSFGGSIPVMAADETSICTAQEEDQGYIDDTTKGLIHFGIGKIPYVGELVDIFAGKPLDNLVDSIFGNEAADPIQELSDQVKKISFQIDDNTKKVLLKLYKTSFEDLNKDFTALRSKTINYLNNINSITSDATMSDVEKAVGIGVMIDMDSSILTDYPNVVDTASKYVTGVNVSQSKPDSLLVRAFKSACSDSVLGGEAALKASGYVNQISTILESAYKVEAMVMDSKLFLADYAKKHPEEYAAIKAKYDRSTLHRRVLEEATLPDKISGWNNAMTTLTDVNDLIFNKDNSGSVLNRYNQMVKNYWFTLIKSTNYETEPANITYMPLNAFLGATTFDACGIHNEDFIKLLVDGCRDSALLKKINEHCECCANILKNNISRIGLTPDETKSIMEHLMDKENIARITGDSTITNAYTVLKDYGFRLDTGIYAVASDLFDGHHRVDGLTDDEVVDIFKPIVYWSCTTEVISDGKCQGGLRGYDFKDAKIKDTTLTPTKLKEGKVYTGSLSDYDYDPNHEHVLFVITDEYRTLVDPWADYKGEAVSTLLANLNQDMSEGLHCTYDYVEEDNNEVEDESIVLTVAEDGQITGEQAGEAWTVAEDGTIILNKDNKFRFEGTVADKNIQNNGEIVDGNFKNVKLELVDNAVITKGTFEDCEITTNENAVIGEEVEFINTTIIDAKDIENEEEEENNTDTDITEIADQN